MVPPTSPDAASTEVGLAAQKKLIAPPNHNICQLRNHIPALAAPIHAMARGAIHVAESSKMTDSVRTSAMWNEL